MNAMTNFTVKSLRANKVRTAVTIAGVALAAALLTAVLTTFTSLQSMLYQAEANVSGTWMAMVQAPSREPLEKEAEAARAAGQIGEAAFVQDAGFGVLTEAQQNIHGRYLPIVSFSGNVETLCAVRPCEGRLPEKPGEIMLFDTWRTGDDALTLGDTLTLPVGERVAVLAPGQEGSMTAGSLPVGGNFGNAEARYGDDLVGAEITDGTVLDSSWGYFEAERDGGIFNEELRNTAERTYTVVGFYNRSSYTTSQSYGMLAFTCDDPNAAGLTSAYVTMEGVSSTAEVEERVRVAFPDDYYELHMGMLRYMGVRTDGAIWDTFFGIVGVLAVVITVACVSLIYNAFAISVAERAGQFGLLASVGASRRQLRRAVLVEALVVAAIGVPLGLLVGLGGCAVTFAALGPSLAAIFGAADVGFTLVVAPWALAVAAGLTVATVLFSVCVPAWRASRVNVIDALRGGQTARASKRGAARAARAANPAKLWKRRGVAGRVFGMGGLLARINEKRGTSRGTAASVSLALAIVLLMTAGSLSTFLGTLADVAGGQTNAGDVGITASFAEESGESSAARGASGDGATDALAAANAGKGAAEGAAGAEGPDGAAGAEGVGEEAADAAVEAGEPLTLEAAVAAANARFAEEVAVFDGAWEALDAVPDAEPVGWRLDGNVPLVVPEAMVGDGARSDGSLNGGFTADGQFVVMGTVVYLDDALFDAVAAEAGVDPADFRDGAAPRAIAVGKAYGNNGDLYQLVDVLAGTGSVEAVTGAIYDGAAVDGFSVVYEIDEQGAGAYRIFPYLFESDGADGGAMRSPDPADVETATTSVEIAAVIEEAPAMVGMYGDTVQLIVPMSLAATQGFGITEPQFHAVFNAPEGQSGDVGQALVDTAGAFFHDETDYEVAFLVMNDYAGDMSNNQMLAMVINVFCLLFTVILALIAMGNVFNTVTNGLILRRREFAVMRSVGLSGRQFRSMIVDECVAWCARGLVPGILLSLAASWLLWRVVSGSMTGLPFALPWTYVALAFAMIAVAVGASVAYGMHRCKADNVVEALRMDSI